MRYTVGDRLELGLRADVTGNSYALRDERVADGLQNIPNAPFVRAGLTWRIPLE